MEWGLEISLMAFFVIACLSEVAVAASGRRVTLPFALGLICMAGFSTALFPTSFVEKSGLLAVGTIAFNVFVINAGTLVDFREIKRQKRDAIFCFTAVAVMALVTGLALQPLMGRNLAVMVPGAVIGNGAANAIAQVTIGQFKGKPELAVFPWLIFMLQGLVSIPIFLALARAEFRTVRAAGLPSGAPPVSASAETSATAKTFAPIEAPPRRTLSSITPPAWKTTAYTLSLLMILSVVNRLIYGAFLSKTGISLNITALLLGVIAGQLGIFDQNPLRSADCFGLLMLGLMALMANTLSKTPLSALIGFLPAAFGGLLASAAVLLLCGLAASKFYHCSAKRGMLLGIACMVPFPASLGLLTQTANKVGGSAQEGGRLAGPLMASVKLISMLSTGFLSIFAASLMLMFAS